MIAVRPGRNPDRSWIREVIRERWDGDTVVAHGVVHEPAALPALVAEDGGRRVGLLTYHVEDEACEIVTIDALEARRGVGAALIEAAKGLGHRRLWLVTTNDNVSAQRFYERAGFRLVAVRAGAVDRARALKPQIPLGGLGGVEIHDELEYELLQA
ncbi:MAG TPA: GNAT family N-acetyltransferase [Actinomycetota bacterium]|nr:GNAT family N-acetyltransferase [Actinomycetota bacterium]